METVWSQHFSQSIQNVTSSIIRDLLHLTQRPSVISFGGGLPAPECFPVEDIQAATEQILIEDPLVALQYGPTEGYQPLRELIAVHMQNLGAFVSAEQIQITTGSQQALDLLGRLMIDPEAPVLVEDPTYLGALQAWRTHNPRFITVPVDEEGLDVAYLERLLAEGVRPRFLYVMSSFQNPTGVTMSLARRQTLIEVISRYHLPVIEDDPYGELYFSGQRATPLAALDVAYNGTLRHVAYLSSFSKLLSPGMRVGWVAAPPELLGKLAHLKQGIDLHTSSLSQATVYVACRDGLLERHVPTIRDIYRRRRDVMMQTLAQTMPAGVRWTEPDGGMFVWLTLPRYFDTTALLRTALDYDVAFVPGTCFYANSGGDNTLRLNFSQPSPDQIREGIGRLGKMMQALVRDKAA
ncbi:MAG: PLP-dependent aminotransferase family protein [Chloroflexaceae bacterium]|nr:PLP-dependent aminotransferase family protein [Chloroflexaceae bacterium]